MLSLLCHDQVRRLCASSVTLDVLLELTQPALDAYFEQPVC
ncbi:hypothetical protein RMSM_04495 [Rhodopirellula maiorica SM1]|uniref:Uncharacterized protein n=1 Tax=Rhodopirellula maiorica SM1 TaxID=1265738 RepID=M5RGR3_9BACT|nr:hypothetical protein RMSM_04495 [Rhodopirellula maiorica SM1]